LKVKEKLEEHKSATDWDQATYLGMLETEMNWKTGIELFSVGGLLFNARLNALEVCRW
jgi:hypothetical protein